MKSPVRLIFSPILFASCGLFAPMLLSTSSMAAVWNGGGADDNWSNGLNWGGTAPVPGDALFFDGATRLTPVNNILADSSFSGITFNSGAAAFTLSGNRITLGGNVTNSSSALQTINLDMILGSTRTINAASGEVSVGGVLSGAGGLTKTGANTLTLTGANSFAGALTVADGTLSTPVWNNDSTNGPLGNSATPITLGGAGTTGTLRFTGQGSNNSPSTIKGLNLTGSGGRVEMVYTAGNRNANYVHINGDRISGSGGLTVDTFAGGATSRFIIIGNAAFTGPTVVAANGELQTNYSDTVNVGTPFGAGTNGLGSPVTLNSGGKLTFFSFGNSATVAIGSLSGSGIVQGEGGGVHTYRIGGDNTDTAFSGVIQDNGGPTAITKVGTGTLTLTGASTNTGVLNINQGAISTNNWNASGVAGPLGAVVNNLADVANTFVQMNGGRINYTGPSAGGDLRGVNLASGNNTFDIVAGSTLNFAGGSNTFQSSGGNLIKEGGGTLQVGTFNVANNIFTGKVIINHGALEWFGAGSMPAPAAVVPDFITINSGAKFQLSYPDFPTTVSANAGFKVSGNAGIQTVGTHEIAGIISDGASAGNIVKTGSGILGLTGANTFTGNVIINEGTVSTNSWNQSGTAGTWGATANNAGAPASTFIQMNGGGIRYTGGSAGGALKGVNLASGNNTIDVIAGSTLNFAGGFNTFQSNGGNLIKEGGGTLQLGTFGIANNIFTGKATINAGALEWFGAGSMPVPAAVVPDFITINNGGKFQLSYPDAPTVVSPNAGFNISGNAGVLTVGDHTLAGVVADGASAGSLTKTGTGTLGLAGANTYTGTLAVEEGTVRINNWNNNGSAGPLGNSSNAVVLGGASTNGTLLYNGPAFLPDNARKGLQLNAGGGTVKLEIGPDRNSYAHLNGSSITGTGGLTVQTGGARFIIVESASYAGPTVVEAGSELQANYTGAGDGTPFGAGANGLGSAVTLNAGSLLTVYSGGGTAGAVAIGSLAGSGTVRGESGGTHTFKIGGDGTSTLFSGSITDAFNTAGAPSAVTKVGAGTLTLTGMSTYSGATIITAGQLLVSGAGNISSSNVTVDGGTLGGADGTVGPTIVNLAGTLAPGSSIGTLNFSSSLMLAGTSVFEIDKTGAILTSDLANVTGALTLGGVLNVTATGDALTLGDTFDLFDAASFSGAFGTVNLPALNPGYSWNTNNLALNGSIVVVPESGTLVLAGFAGLLLARRRRI